MSTRRRGRAPRLWSIAAGPLVNVVLVPLLGSLLTPEPTRLWIPATRPHLYDSAASGLWINVGLLVFNILPIYPLDGGQIFRSLLWFVLGAPAA